MELNPAMQILIENAKTFADRNEIRGLMESEIKAVNNTMITNLYKSAIEKSHIDFEDIPNSKGDVTRYSGYKSMVDTLALVKEIASKHNAKIPEIETVEDALNNIIAFRESFDKGFRLDKEFIILQYNTLVYATVEATSILVSSYVDFAKRPDRVEFTIMRDSKRGGYSAIQNLAKFNMAVKKGDYSKVMNAVIKSGKEGLVGVDDMVIPALIIGGVLAIVPAIRELIFGFYYSRMKLSDYLEQQAQLLEINRQSIEASQMSAKEKNQIIKKQQAKINDLRRLSDKIKVDRTMSDNKAAVALQSENKNWTIGDVKTQSASMDNNGFQLL
jgi:hypothetical protein